MPATVIIEHTRLHEDFKRLIKTQTVLPSPMPPLCRSNPFDLTA
jgi:hypothetical protein